VRVRGNRRFVVENEDAREAAGVRRGRDENDRQDRGQTGSTCYVGPALLAFLGCAGRPALPA
jgi:hypothetical protein